MTDPYKVLGVPPSATDDQIKEAYRQLARKYHPDNYANNPLADLATEKMKEINEAYDEIQRRRKGGGGQSAGGSSGYGGSYGYGGGFGGFGGGYQGSAGSSSAQGPSQFEDVRRMISNARILEAEEVLDGVPTAKRDAEWHFLKGTIAYQKGWLDAALGYFGNACRMAPGNQEYRAAYQRLVYQQQSGYGRAGMGGGSMCETCATVYCCSSLCNCCGSGC